MSSEIQRYKMQAGQQALGRLQQQRAAAQQFSIREQQLKTLANRALQAQGPLTRHLYQLRDIKQGLRANWVQQNMLMKKLVQERRETLRKLQAVEAQLRETRGRIGTVNQTILRAQNARHMANVRGNLAGALAMQSGQRVSNARLNLAGGRR
jgi:hypothetical protein